MEGLLGKICLPGMLPLWDGGKLPCKAGGHSPGLVGKLGKWIDR